MNHSTRRARRWRSLWLLLLWSASALPACQTVEFYERRHLSDPVMALSDDPLETHFYQKCFYSREGSAGGIGASAGGGCGCY